MHQVVFLKPSCSNLLDALLVISKKHDPAYFQAMSFSFTEHSNPGLIAINYKNMPN